MANTTKAETKAKETETNEPKMVTICLPLTRAEKDDVYVAVNGDSFLIKRGENVTVPEYVVKVLQQKEEMLKVAMEFEEKAQSKMP